MNVISGSLKSIYIIDGLANAWRAGFKFMFCNKNPPSQRTQKKCCYSKYSCFRMFGAILHFSNCSKNLKGSILYNIQNIVCFVVSGCLMQFNILVAVWLRLNLYLFSVINTRQHQCHKASKCLYSI